MRTMVMIIIVMIKTMNKHAPPFEETANKSG